MIQVDRPVVSAVFFQADTVKGYRFWDEVGLVANKYVDRFQAVNYGGIPNTLSFAGPHDPGDHLLELRVSTQNIWLAYKPRVSWVTVRQETTRDVEWIARAIGVTQFSRQGLRVNLLWAATDREQVTETLVSRVLRVKNNGWSTLGQMTGGDLVLYLTHGRLTARVEISPVMNVLQEQRLTVPGERSAQPPSDIEALPDFALSVDVDLADTHVTDSLDVKPHLNRCVQYLQETLVPWVTELLQRGD